MGRAARWFKGMFGKKKSDERRPVSDKGGGSDNSGDDLPTEHVLLKTFLTDTEKEQSKHATVVATITSSPAEAAVSAAKAAAVKIQKVFRGSLARKALRALKGIVKLQALVRGYLVRKRAAAMLQSIEALIRVQTAMRTKRINRLRLNKEFKDMFQPRQALDKFDEAACDERSPKIVDMGHNYKRRSRKVQNAVTMSDYENDFAYKENDGLELSFTDDKWKFATAQNTPRYSSSSHHHAANNRYYVMQSPAKSVRGNALCDDYGRIVSSPGYMENTQSFKAKVRSHSAPRQRAERKKRLSLDEVMASRSSGVNILQPQRHSCSYDPY